MNAARTAAADRSPPRHERGSWFSWQRWWAIVVKEFIQLRRDRLTFGMIVGIPIMQLMLFGFAINTDPKHLPTAIIAADHSEFTRIVRRGDADDRLLRHRRRAARRGSGPRGARAAASVAVRRSRFPADFTRRLLRGERPALLVEADATDPTATGTALAAIAQLVDVGRAQGSDGPLAVAARRRRRRSTCACTASTTPKSITQYNIVPGLMGVILTMTMVMMTGLAITRERERGTMENLLAMPVTPLEVMTGKIVPYIVDRADPGDDHPARGALHLPRADRGQPRRALRRVAAVHRVQPHGRHHVLVARAQPAAGDADHVLLFPADHPAVGIHVPVPRHAGVGAVRSAACCRSRTSTGWCAASCSRATTGPTCGRACGRSSCSRSS